MSFIIAIDGPAGSGKGTVAKAIGERLNFVNIDTGAMYRCVSLYMLQNNIKLEEEEKIKEALDNGKIKIEQKKIDGKDKFYLNGEDVSLKIREKPVNSIVSQVSHIVCVRSAMVDLQRDVASNIDVIMEGRDIGTNVFPNADIKIYLDATPEDRARRRIRQNKEQGIESNYEEILESIKFRDHNDKTSDVAPLKQAEDAIYFDNTGMEPDECVEKILEIINNILKRG